MLDEGFVQSAIFVEDSSDSSSSSTRFRFLGLDRDMAGGKSESELYSLSLSSFLFPHSLAWPTLVRAQQPSRVDRVSGVQDGLLYVRDRKQRGWSSQALRGNTFRPLSTDIQTVFLPR